MTETMNSGERHTQKDKPDPRYVRPYSQDIGWCRKEERRGHGSSHSGPFYTRLTTRRDPPEDPDPGPVLDYNRTRKGPDEREDMDGCPKKRDRAPPTGRDRCLDDEDDVGNSHE